MFSVDLSITLELAASLQQADIHSLEFIFQVCANMREIDMGGVVVADSREICFLDMMALSLDDSCFRPESSSADTNRHLFEQSSFAGLPEFYL